MSEEITLIYNNPDPQAGGIPRYSYEIKEGVKESDLHLNKIDFTQLKRDNIIQKTLNIFYRRNKFIKDNKKKLTATNLFLQPEIYFPTKRKDIVTIHDIYAIRNWEPKTLYERIKQEIYRSRIKKVKKNAELIISVSELTKNQLIDEGFDKEKIKTINLGVRNKFDAKATVSEQKSIGYIGDFSPRKRVKKMLEDYEENKEKMQHDLCLGGSGGSDEKRIKEKYSGSKRINFEGRVPEKSLVEWYNKLQAFVFPSESEGFGLPILEATACETPVFVYKDAKITPEVRKYCFEIESINQISHKLEEISKKTLEKNAREVKEKFNWQKTVDKTIKLQKKH